MTIETTMLISHKRMQKLRQVSLLIGKSRMRLVINATKKLMKKHDKFLKIKGPVEYQEKIGADKWHRMHVVLLPHEYEFFCDMRKFCKMSVSLLAAIAIDSFLDEIIEEHVQRDANKKETDNYLFHCYIIVKEVIKGNICWKLYWGYPGEEHLIPSIE